MEFYRLEFTEDELVKPRLSLVNDPAIELKGIMLSKNKQTNKVNLSKLQYFNDDKQIVAGPALIYDKWIERVDETDNKYYVVFTPQDVNIFKDAFEKNGSIINFEHTDRIIKAEILLSELIDDSGINSGGFEQNYKLKKGDWFVAIKIQDKEDWKEIKNGEHNGFSIESMFEHNLIQFNKNKNKEVMTKTELEEFKKDIINEFKTLLSKEDKETETELEDVSLEDVSLEDKETELEEDKETETELEEDKETETELEEDKEFEFTQEMYNSILTELADLAKSINELKTVNDQEDLTLQKEEDVDMYAKLSKEEARIKRIAYNLSKNK